MNLETAYYVHRHVLPAAFALLPGQMSSAPAHAMLLAIGLQESEFDERVQVPAGPAHGFWQFERAGGVRGVLQTQVAYLMPTLGVLNYGMTEADLYAAIVHNDVLAAVFARLLLWSVPGTLPREGQASLGWHQYLLGWRPGKPHQKTWAANFSTAWKLTMEGPA